MKLGSQPLNAHGPATFASGTPTVLPTNPNSPFAKLVAKNEVGQIVQQWLLLQNKCTLGSASSCALRCQLSGIAPYHALLVMGARQVFIRALAPKLARNGVIVNELLLTEDQSTFEIAGHQFELIRNLKTNEPTSSDQPASQNKMKFTLARPMEIGQVRQPTVIPTQVPQTPSKSPTPAPTARTVASPVLDQNQASFERLQPKADSTELQPQWITDLIQSAMLPLERQLNGIIEPLAAVQNELDKRARLERKRRNRSSNRRRASDRDMPDRDIPETREPENNFLERNTSVQFAAERIAAERIAAERIAAEQFAREQFEREQLEREQLEREQLVREREQLERERSALNAAFTTQIDVQPQISNISEPLIVPVISPEVQAQLARQSETLDNLNARLTEVKSNLGSLERIVSENFVTVIGATTAPASTPEPVNEALNRITSVTDQLKASVANQLNGLTSQLDEVKNNLGSLQQTVSENLASTNELRSAPEPASQEALQRLTEVANQLSHLLQEINTRQISSVQSLEQSIEQSEVAWREQFRAQEVSELEWREHLRAQEVSELEWREQLRAQEVSELEWREQLRAREKSDLEWREQLKAQIGELRATITATESSIQSATESSIEKATQATRAAQAEILAATEAAILKASELRSSTPKGTCPTSAALLTNGHLKATIESVPATQAPASQAPASQAPATRAPASRAPASQNLIQSFQAPIAVAPAVVAQISASPAYEAPVNVAPAINSTPAVTAPVNPVPTIAAEFNPAQVDASPVEAVSAFPMTGFATEEPVNSISESPAFVANVAEEIVELIQQPASNVADEPELPLNQFAQYSWNPEPNENSVYGFAIEQNPSPTPAPFESAWDVTATPSPTPAIDDANASANFIEETIEEAPMLEEASSSALPSWWTEDDKTQFKDDSSASAALSSAWNISKLAATSPADPSSSVGSGVYLEGFASPAEDSGYQSASAWDVEVKHESSQVELEAPASLIEPQVASLDDIAPFESLPAHSLNEIAIQTPLSQTPLSQTAPSETAPSADDESYELSSLLERFGIAREPAREPVREPARDSAAYEPNELRKDRKPVAKREIVEELQSIDSVAIDQTEVVRVQPEPIAAPELASEPEPVSSVSPQPAFEPAASPSAEAGEEESIEDYMKRLMARMRGGSLEEEPKPVPVPVVKTAPAPIQSSDSMSSSKIALPGAATERAPSSTTGPFNPEEYVPKALAPEKTRNMAAMRELANTSARSAIQVSARRRYGTAIAMKLAIALIGLGVGITLVMINGLNVNIGLIATVASFLVALIWGFDAFSTLKPLLYAAVESLETAPPPTPTPEADEPAQI